MERPPGRSARGGGGCRRGERADGSPRRGGSSGSRGPGGRGLYPGSRAWTRAKAEAAGCAESMATLTLRAETITRAPVLRSLRRSVPAVARASPVPASARRRAAMRMEAKAEKRSRSWLAGRREAEVRSANRSGCCSLDGVLGVAPEAVRALVDGSGGDRLGQGGDDEAGIGLAGQVFGLGDDAARAGPARPGGVLELHEDADRAAAAPRLDPGRRGAPA